MFVCFIVYNVPMKFSFSSAFSCNLCQLLPVASQFSMQSSEVYKLHSFFPEVYSFWQSRSQSPKSYDNICTFLVGISSICVFLFDWAFVIIFVYNERCAEAPFLRDVFT